MLKLFPRFLYIVFFAFTLQACSDNDDVQNQSAGKYGMLDPNTPHYAAMKFFEHIYYDSNLNGAVELSTPRMGRLLQSYHNNRNVQRHVLNLIYDEVEIQPDAGNSVGRAEFAKKAVVSVFFTGHRHDKKHEDIRVVEMVKMDGDWKVSKVRADKYL
ncbi:hypothetical protein OE749_11815 [Aestuariibacter sp. AA17]|uniref:Lipoprotein n=1 Tax=Fluctibacter corallii TaxID=2984329 RepID=A0ABT3A9N3_9ALTE|nr:hypothetical protein [Aestuariibacter sp. AA17]MCV2885381.1 hypothetical protein [Aestuariibacter sp. AA17]